MADLPEKTAQSSAPQTDIEQLKDHNIQHSEILVDKELMTNAFEGENREHEETVWQAAKAHPMACFWAFIMCFTIVRIMSEQ